MKNFKALISLFIVLLATSACMVTDVQEAGISAPRTDDSPAPTNQFNGVLKGVADTSFNTAGFFLDWQNITDYSAAQDPDPVIRGLGGFMIFREVTQVLASFPNGDLLVEAKYENSFTPGEFALRYVRMTESGGLRTSFAQSGRMLDYSMFADYAAEDDSDPLINGTAGTMQFDSINGVGITTTDGGILFSIVYVHSDTFNSHTKFVKLNSTGQRDTSFGLAGILADVSSMQSYDSADDENPALAASPGTMDLIGLKIVAALPQGKLLAVNTYTHSVDGGTYRRIVRLNKNGTLDTSFADQGYLRTLADLPSYPTLNDFDSSLHAGLGTMIAVAVERPILAFSDGAFLLSITYEQDTSGDQVERWVRMKANGTVDTSFGHAGVLNSFATFSPYAASLDYDEDVRLQGDNMEIIGLDTAYIATKDGGFVASAVFAPLSGALSRNRYVKFTKTGLADDKFGEAGALIRWQTFNDYDASLDVDPLIYNDFGLMEIELTGGYPILSAPSGQIYFEASFTHDDNSLVRTRWFRLK